MCFDFCCEPNMDSQNSWVPTTQLYQGGDFVVDQPIQYGSNKSFSTITAQPSSGGMSSKLSSSESMGGEGAATAIASASTFVETQQIYDPNNIATTSTIMSYQNSL